MLRVDHANTLRWGWCGNISWHTRIHKLKGKRPESERTCLIPAANVRTRVLYPSTTFIFPLLSESRKKRSDIMVESIAVRRWVNVEANGQTKKKKANAMAHQPNNSHSGQCTRIEYFYLATALDLSSSSDSPRLSNRSILDSLPTIFDRVHLTNQLSTSTFSRFFPSHAHISFTPCCPTLLEPTHHGIQPKLHDI